MDNSTRFDVNEAIRRWRNQLAAAPAFHSADLEELEVHLKDSMAALQAQGLSEAEAFWVAQHRLGTAGALSEEFGKVNGELVWLERAIWMVVGVLAIGVLSGLAAAVANVAVFGTYLGLASAFQPKPVESVAGIVGWIVNTVAILGLPWWMWRSARKQGSCISRLGAGLTRHPLLAAIGFVCASVLMSASQVGANWYAAKVVSISSYGALMVWHMGWSLLAMVLWPAVLAWLLIRRSRQSASS